MFHHAPLLDDLIQQLDDLNIAAAFNEFSVPSSNDDPGKSFCICKENRDQSLMLKV